MDLRSTTPDVQASHEIIFCQMSSLSSRHSALLPSVHVLHTPRASQSSASNACKLSNGRPRSSSRESRVFSSPSAPSAELAMAAGMTRVSHVSAIASVHAMCRAGGAWKSVGEKDSSNFAWSVWARARSAGASKEGRAGGGDARSDGDVPEGGTTCVSSSKWAVVTKE
jgi:hypothetical protein